MAHIARTVFCLAPRIIGGYFSWMRPYSKHPEKYPIEKRYGKVKSLICSALKHLGVKTLVLGKENIPEGNACYFANHLAVSDPLLYFPIFDKPIAFVGKKEIEKIPFAGKAFAAGGGLFLDRQDLKQELRVMMKVQERLKEGKISYLIYAEGTRNKDQMAKLLPFHPGTFRAAMKAGVPIVPVINYGAFRILSNKTKFKEYPTIVKFLKPIMPNEYEGKKTEEIAQIVQSMMQKEISFVVKKLDHQNMIDSKEKDYRFNLLY